MKKLLLVLIFYTGCSALLAQQTSKVVTVNGKVIAKVTQLPMAQVTLSTVLNKQSVATRPDGSFKLILVSWPDTLVVSFVGYVTQRIPIKRSAPSVTIELDLNGASLETVVVNTGYQKIKPNEINGAVTLISNATLNQQTGTNILQRLQYVTSGLSINANVSNGAVGSTTGISIRGFSTINAGTDPIIVLDNFIYEGSINNINPNDVENITILKDASAASIWGARAGNGVIVITTKKGRLNQPLKVDFNSTLIVTEKPDLMKQKDMSVSEYLEIEQFMFNQGYFDGQISIPYLPLTPATEIFLKRREGLISAADSATAIDNLKQNNARKEYTDLFYQRAISQQYALSLSGGSSRMSWLLAGNYDRSTNSLSGKYNKINLRFFNTYKLTDKLQAEVGVYYTNSETVNGKPDFNYLSTIGGRNVPYLSYKDPQGNPAAVDKELSSRYTDTAGGGKLLDWNYYPLTDYLHNKATTRLDEIVASIGFSYQIIKPLQLTLNYQQQQQRSQTDRLADIQSYSTRNNINLFTQVDPATGLLSYAIPLGDILGIEHAAVRSQNARGQFNFDQTWGKHMVRAIAGGEVRERSTTTNSGIYYGYIDDPMTFAQVDQFNPYPTYITGNTRTIQGPGTPTQTKYRFVSAYANASYSFDERYSLSISARKDGSNIFGVTTNDQWKPLWSAGLGWNISKEQFYQVSWFPVLRLRASLGISGNVDVNRTALPLANFFTNSVTNYPAANIRTVNNPSLKWEQSKQFNIGADFTAGKGAFSGSIDYYKKRGTDLYAGAPYDYTAWGTLQTITKNVADMEGHGIDLVLNSKIINSTFQWNNTFLFNYVTAVTTKYYGESALSIASVLGGGNSLSPIIGKPLYSIAALRWGGLDEFGKVRGILNGIPSTDYSAILNSAYGKGDTSSSIVFTGSGLPIVFGSLINSFSWKHINLTIAITYKAGYFYQRPALSYTGIYESGFGQADYNLRWKQPGDEKFTQVPVLEYPSDYNAETIYANADIHIRKGDHVRLQYINMAYSLPVKLKGGKLSQLEVYGNAANIGILWRANKDQADPDYPYTVPPPVSLSVGIRANF